MRSDISRKIIKTIEHIWINRTRSDEKFSSRLKDQRESFVYGNCFTKPLKSMFLTVSMIHRRIIRVDTYASQMHDVDSTILLQHRLYELQHGISFRM